MDPMESMQTNCINVNIVSGNVLKCLSTMSANSSSWRTSLLLVTNSIPIAAKMYKMIANNTKV